MLQKFYSRKVWPRALRNPFTPSPLRAEVLLLMQQTMNTGHWFIRSMRGEQLQTPVAAHKARTKSRGQGAAPAAVGLRFSTSQRSRLKGYRAP